MFKNNNKEITLVPHSKLNEMFYFPWFFSLHKILRHDMLLQVTYCHFDSLHVTSCHRDEKLATENYFLPLVFREANVNYFFIRMLSS